MITHGLWFLQAQHEVLTTKDWTGDMGIRIQEFLHFAFLYDMIRNRWFHFFPYILSPSHHSLPLSLIQILGRMSMLHLVHLPLLLQLTCHLSALSLKKPSLWKNFMHSCNCSCDKSARRKPWVTSSIQSQSHVFDHSLT